MDYTSEYIIVLVNLFRIRFQRFMSDSKMCKNFFSFVVYLSRKKLAVCSSYAVRSKSSETIPVVNNLRMRLSCVHKRKYTLIVLRHYVTCYQAAIIQTFVTYTYDHLEKAHLV